MKQVEELPGFINSTTLMVYWSIKGEVYTHDFIRKWVGKKRIILPSVDGENMYLKQSDENSCMIPGDIYDIPEPEGPLFVNYNEIDLIVVPGIAFDKSNNRMGRGKGYYDRFLHSKNATKAGVCFRFQLFDKIPAGEYDVKMDMVITNSVRMK
ncbi:MAG: 5-formyltetrahydrofolate cyclo-ligase [Bacteroidota bacterium]